MSTFKNTTNTAKLKYGTYSFSKIQSFKSCPMKFKFSYIDKIYVKKTNPALIKGSKIHSMLENYEPETPLESNEHTDIVRNFINSNIGKEIMSKKCVKELGISFDLKLNPYIISMFPEGETMLFKGFIDRVNRVGDTIEIIDYKTGKYKDPKYQDYEQLSYYALWFFKTTKVKSIKIRYVYVEHNMENTLVITNPELIEKELMESINKIETTTEFCKNKTPLCNWCDFKDICEASGDKFNI